MPYARSAASMSGRSFRPWGEQGPDAYSARLPPGEPTPQQSCSGLAHTGGSLFRRKNPDRTPLRDIGVFVRFYQVETSLHARGIHPPAGLDSNVLLAIELKGDRDAVYTGASAELPKRFAGRGVEGPEIAVVGAPGEDNVSGSSQHWAPQLGFFEIVRPHLLPGIEVPRLQLADVISVGPHLHGCYSPGIAFTRGVFDRLALDRAA